MSRPGESLRLSRVFDELDNRPRFFFVIFESLQRDFWALAVLRPESLSASADVVLNDRISRIKNCVGGTIVLLELDNFDFGKVLLHVEQIGDFSDTPTVDTLVNSWRAAEISNLLDMEK